jgi:hypothetical protein
MKRLLILLAAVVATGFVMIPGKSGASGGDRVAAASASGGQLGCQICQVVGGSWVCQPVGPGGYGAPLCTVTTSGQSCHLDGLCQAPPSGGGHGGFDDDDDDDAADAAAHAGVSHSKRRLTLDPDVIRRIAEAAPRFAMALAVVNREGGFAKSPSRMYLTPIELTTSDIEAYIAPGELPAEYVKEMATRTAQVNAQIAKGQVAPVLYTIEPERFGSMNPVVRVRVQQTSLADPSYSELVLRFSIGRANRSTVDGSVTGAETVQWTFLKQ